MDRASRPEGSISDIQHGWDVFSSDEQKVGNVSEVSGNYVVAHKGFFFPKDLYIPFSAVERIEHDRVYLNVSKGDVDASGWDMAPADYQAGAMTGEATTGGWGARERPAATARSETTAKEGEQTLHLHEEELRANKEQVQTGEVRLGKEVVEEQQTLNVPVTRDEVFVERVPGDRQPDDHAIGEREQETITVPLTEERVTAEKVPVLTEEVRVGTRPVQETQQVSDTVKREEARIQNEGNANIAGTSGTSPVTRTAENDTDTEKR